MMLRGFRTNGMMFGGGHMLIGLLIFAVIITLIVLLIVHISKRMKANNAVQPSAAAHSPALDALKMKYASGEITEEEYLKRKDVLSRN